MEIASDFSLRPISKQDEPARSDLLRRGTPTGTVVPGTVLEAQVRLDNRHLILTTDDCR